MEITILQARKNKYRPITISFEITIDSLKFRIKIIWEKIKP